MSENKDHITTGHLYELIKTVITQNKELREELKETKNQITTQITELKKEFTEQYQQLVQANEKLREDNDRLKEKINTIERRLKKFSFVVYGLEEEGNQTDDIQSILKILNETLNITCNFGDFRDFYRIGIRTGESIRPVVVETVSYSLKTAIIANAKHLKGTGIFVTQDYTEADYNKRKILVTRLKEARKSKLNAKIKNNKLIINNVEYSIESLERETPKVIEDALAALQRTQEINEIRRDNEHPREISTQNRVVNSQNPQKDNNRKEKKKEETAAQQPMSTTRSQRK
nr:unnamed protein product [Callosobruchus analis]